MFNVVEKVLDEVVRSSRSPTSSETEMRSLVQNKSIAHKIVKSVLFHTMFIVSIAKSFGKMADRFVGKYHLGNMEEASKTVSDTEQLMERLPQ